MKLKYLGTAAAEGVPAVFCNCGYCCEARRIGGKNIRTRSQTLINDDLLIDFPADTYAHFLSNGIDGDKIKYMLITHSHIDHFYPEELKMRGGLFAHSMREPHMHILCGKGTYAKISDIELPDTIMPQLILPFETKQLGNYIVTALPAKHYPGDGALFYIIERDGKAVLYAHDTGYFYESVFEYIKMRAFKFDLISLDCTNIDIAIADDGTHMGLDNIRRVVKKLKIIGAVHSGTIKVINHFSHNANPIHHILEEKVADDGYVVSYDGMIVEI